MNTEFHEFLRIVCFSSFQSNVCLNYWVLTVNKCTEYGDKGFDRIQYLRSNKQQ